MLLSSIVLKHFQCSLEVLALFKRRKSINELERARTLNKKSFYIKIQEKGAETKLHQNSTIREA